MKISEIVASLVELKQTVAGLIGDKTKATAEALSQFSDKLHLLEFGAVAELSQKSADLLTAQELTRSLAANCEKAQGEVNAIGGSLKSACAALSLEIKADATSLEMISALQGAVTATLAKLQVDPAKVPVAVVNKNGEAKLIGKLTLDEQIAARKNGDPTK